MDGEMIVCPECNKEIPKYADKCPNCGFPLSAVNNMAKCPECGSNVSPTAEKCSSCGYPLKLISTIKNCPECGNPVSTTDEKCNSCGYPLKGNFEIKAVNHVDPKKRIIGIIGIALVVVGIVFAFLSYKTRFMGEYDYYAGIIDRYEDNIRDYRNSKKKMLDEANSFNPGFFRDSYNNIANRYQNLIYDAEDSIDECKGKQREIVKKAVIMLIVAIGMAGVGVFLIMKKSRKKHNGNDYL